LLRNERDRSTNSVASCQRDVTVRDQYRANGLVQLASLIVRWTDYQNSLSRFMGCRILASNLLAAAQG
jgi:hypothetical protein